MLSRDQIITMLLWSFTGIAGSAALAVCLLVYATGRVGIAFWLALLLPGLAIGIGQQVVLRRRLNMAVSRFWMLGSVTTILAPFAAELARNDLATLAFVTGVIGMIPGFIQMQAIEHRFIKRSWWMTLSGLGHAFGCTLAFSISDGLRLDTTAAVLLAFPCIALFTGAGIVFIAQSYRRSTPE